MKQYEELARVGSKYHKDKNFCGVIALAVATNIKFTKAQGLLRKYGRIKKKGTPFLAFWNSLKDLGFANVSVWRCRQGTNAQDNRHLLAKTSQERYFLDTDQQAHNLRKRWCYGGLGSKG